MNRIFPLLHLHDDVLSYEGQQFFDLVNRTCGRPFKDLMEKLSIDTTYKLLSAENDIYSVFQKNYQGLEKIKQEICFQLDDGTIMIKPGLKFDFDRLIESLRAFIDQKQKRTTNTNNDVFSLLENFKELVKGFLNKDSSHNYSFIISLFENIFNNLSKSKNNYRYSEPVLNFAKCLYVLAGRNAYEFIRLNLPGGLPSLITLKDSFFKAGSCIEEGKFRYNSLRDHQNTFNYQVASCSEDATAVIKKIVYNSSTNTFIGFSTLLKHGIPLSNYFQTDSFDELKEWFDTVDKSKYLNIHMIQPLSSSVSSSPFLLSGYGIRNDFKAVDILHRWLWIYEKSRESNVRIVAFCTDCDSRYLLSMRLAMGYFAKYRNTSVSDHVDQLTIDLQKDWSSWFFLEKKQLFFCFQDPVHLCTKLRNRILSSTASLLIGNQSVSLNILMNLIENESKLVHGLVKSDIDVKDRQNFHSCFKITRDDVLIALENIDDSLATRIYLLLIRSIILAYVEHDTPLIDRLYHSWFSVFICRIWQTWLQVANVNDLAGCSSDEDKKNLFITVPAHFSIEINAHCLLGICLLVRQCDLPESALDFSNYHSQSCESTFRLARSMTGTFSTITNFTIEQFLKRAGKLAVLTDIENKSISNQLSCPLKFPKHHKKRRNLIDLKRSTSNSSVNVLTNENIEQTIYRSFDDAYKLLSHLNVNYLLDKHKKSTLIKISSSVKNQFERKFKNVSYDDNENYSSDDESSDQFQSDDDSISERDEDSFSEDEGDESSVSASGKHEFRGMRVVDNVPPSLANSYFSIKIDGRKKMIHKQTACWLLTDDKAKLSSDRTQRVRQ